VTAIPRVLLIGAGAMGSRHARITSLSGRASLAGVVDPRKDVGSALAAQYGADWFPELPDDLAGLDGVVIAAATEAHYSLALDVLGAGVPLFVEKPLADSLQQTLEIIDESERRGVPLMCGFVERYNPAVITARALFDAPVHVTATRHSPYAPRIRTGVAWDLLVHDVDLVLTTFGAEPTRVESLTGRFDARSLSNTEDVAEVLLAFPSGGIGHISSSRVSQRKVRSLWVHDIDKLVEIDLLRRDVTVFRNVADQPADAGGRGYRQETIIEIPEIVNSREPLAEQFDHFADLLTGAADADAERATIAGAHRVVAQLVMD